MLREMLFLQVMQREGERPTRRQQYGRVDRGNHLIHCLERVLLKKAANCQIWGAGQLHHRQA